MPAAAAEEFGLDKSDPRAAARAALAAGRFGFIWSRTLISAAPVGVTCHAPLPHSAPALTAGEFSISDEIPDEAELERERAELAAHGRFAHAYNAAVLSDPRFPYKDLCRMRLPSDTADDFESWSRPATSAPVIIRSLADAARAGDEREVLRRLARGEAVDGVDDFEMTALAWAVARGGDRIALRLLAAGATPMNEDRRRGATSQPLFIAVALRRSRLFDQLLHRVPPDTVLPDEYLEAAAAAGNTSGLVRLLSRHGPASAPLPQRLLHRAVERDRLDTARRLLVEFKGTLGPEHLLETAIQSERLALVREALHAGADPAAPLPWSEGLALNSLAHTPESIDAPQIARELIAAGAQVNARGRGQESALEALLRGRRDNPAARQLLEVLLQAGADVRRTDATGVPIVFLALGMFRAEQTPRNPPDGWLEALVAAGADLNASWSGQTALNVVLRAPGEGSLLAGRLRGLGARLSAPR